MWSFWDALMFSTVMAARDYYRDRERNMLRLNQYKQTCMEKISENASGILKDIGRVIEKQRTVYMSDSISEGIVQLPMYAFFLVLKYQPINATKEQKKVVEMFSRNLSMPYSTNDFYFAVKSDNSTRSYIEDLVGISKTYAGKFWKEFFKAVYRTESEEEIVTSIIEKFANIVMNFAIIGDSKMNCAEIVLQNFMESVGFQAANCRRLPQDEIDIYGDKNYIEHYHNFENEYKKIVRLTKSEEEGLPAFEIYPYFCMGVIYQIVNQSTRNRVDKATYIDYVMKQCGMKFSYDGNQIIDSVQKSVINQDNELGWWISNLLSNEKAGLSFWQIMATLSGKCKDYNYDTVLIPELCGFLIGMDGELNKKYPMSGFGNLAKPYLANKLKELNDLIDTLEDIPLEEEKNISPVAYADDVNDNNSIIENFDLRENNFEIDYIEFRKAIKDVLNASDYLEKITSFNNVMAAVYLYEIMLVLDFLPVFENEKISIYKELMKKYQLDLSDDEEMVKLYYLIKARVGGWEELIPSAALPDGDNEIGSFWLFMIGATKEANLNMDIIIDLLGLHSKYLLSMEREFESQYQMIEGFHEKLEEYIQSTVSTVSVYLMIRGLLSYEDDNRLVRKVENKDGSTVTKESVVQVKSKKETREDLSGKFRTSWEANIARVLNYCGIHWQYEPQYFSLDLKNINTTITPQYLPDFVLNDGTIIEVKQNWDKRNAEKMQIVMSQMNERKIVIIDSDYYRCIQNVFSDKIEEWEFEDNIRTTYQIHIVGITKPERKEFVRHLVQGDELFVELSKDNTLILVKDTSGNVIGNVSKSYASIFLPKILAGFQYSARLKTKSSNNLVVDFILENTDYVVIPDVIQCNGIE